VLNEGRLMLSLSTISDTTDERGGTNGWALFDPLTF
jgi:hypothetical protein